MVTLRHEGGSAPEREAAKFGIIKPLRELNLRIFGSEKEMMSVLVALYTRLERYNADWATPQDASYVIAAEAVKNGEIGFTVNNKKIRLALLEDSRSHRLSLGTDDPDLKVALLMGLQSTGKK